MSSPNLGPVRTFCKPCSTMKRRSPLKSSYALAGDASEDSVLRDFDANPDDCYAKMKLRVLAGLGLKPSMVDARPTQHACHVSGPDIKPTNGLFQGPGAVRQLVGHQGEPHSQFCAQSRPSSSVSTVAQDVVESTHASPCESDSRAPCTLLPAVRGHSIGCSDEDDEVDCLRFDSSETAEGIGLVERSSANGESSFRLSTGVGHGSTTACALAECQPNASQVQERRGSQRVGKRKAEEAVNRSLQAFRRLSGLGATRDEIDDDEADALDMM